MEKAKIQLSSEELDLMQNSSWILTKNSLMEKLVRGMGELSGRMQQELLHREQLLPPSLLESNPKISRGEKYIGLPYLMLDYPRLFEKENILAIRTFFWWGNFCSVTLHVKGKYQAYVLGNCLNNLGVLTRKGIYSAVSSNEWNHDLLSPAYEALQDCSKHDMELMAARRFIKLSSLTRLSNWGEMEDELFDAFRMWITMIGV